MNIYFEEACMRINNGAAITSILDDGMIRKRNLFEKETYFIVKNLSLVVSMV